MKLLITSPAALIDNATDDFFPGIVDALNNFLAMDDENAIVVTSRHQEKLDRIPEQFNPFFTLLRGSPKLIELLKTHTECDAEDILILGGNEYDLFYAANSKSLLLRAHYAIGNNPTDKLYVNKYGIPIRNANALQHFFEHFTNVDQPWYYTLNVSDKTTVYALTNANTIAGVTAKQAALNNAFKACLKRGATTYRLQFMIYFLVCAYEIIKELEKVNYWGIYPSSGIASNEDLEYFETKARQMFNCKTKEPIFLRTKASTKRHGAGKTVPERIEDGCEEQFDTIIINPYYKKGNKLVGKCVCIIDDFTTTGGSCETARHLLEKAGVAKVVFITLGKFGDKYEKYDYTLKGDVFNSYTYTRNRHKAVKGIFNTNSNFEYIQSLGDML